MDDAVIVPLLEEQPPSENPLRPSVAPRWADCTLVGGVGQEILVADEGPADAEALEAVRRGVRLALDLDGLLAPPRLRRPPSVGRPDWWPPRGEIYYGHRYGAQRERYAVVTDDEWNVRNDYATCAFVTSQLKTWRKRWEIPLSMGSRAITGDIEPFPYVELDERGRPPHGERTLTRDDLAALGRGLELSLELYGP
jgi:hypothetical protein